MLQNLQNNVDYVLCWQCIAWEEITGISGLQLSVFHLVLNSFHSEVLTLCNTDKLNKFKQILNKFYKIWTKQNKSKIVFNVFQTKHLKNTVFVADRSIEWCAVTFSSLSHVLYDIFLKFCTEPHVANNANKFPIEILCKYCIWPKRKWETQSFHSTIKKICVVLNEHKFTSDLKSLLLSCVTLSD